MWGRDMFGLVNELGEEQFDSSLGCPLSTYEEATLNLIGGKALQCWRLMKFGLPVPNSFVIPTFVYSMHIETAGVVDLIDEVFGSDLRDETIREAAKPKLEEIRKKIMETPLLDEVVQNLEAWIDIAAGGATFAVRSSGSAEGKILNRLRFPRQILSVLQCSNSVLFLILQIWPDNRLLASTIHSCTSRPRKKLSSPSKDAGQACSRTISWSTFPRLASLVNLETLRNPTSILQRT